MKLTDHKPYITILGLDSGTYRYRGEDHQKVKHTRHMSKERALHSTYQVIAQDGTVLCTGKLKSTENFCRKQQNGNENFHHSPSRNHGLIDKLKKGQTVTVYVKKAN